MTPPGREPPALAELVAAAGALVAYNGVLNVRPPANAVYVPANLGLTAAALGLGRRWGLTVGDIGLGDAIRGLVAGGVGATVCACAIGLGYATVPRARPLFDDARATGLEGAALASYALVRIPLGTALAEEVVFRGVLEPGLARRLSPIRARLAANAVFGLWHIGPTLRLLRDNDVALGAARTALAVASAVVATTAAGVGFSLLRRSARSLAAPIVAHAAVNAASLFAAVLHQRATRSTSRPTRSRRSGRARPRGAARR